MQVLEVQTLDSIAPQLDKLLNNKNRSLSGIFKALRREKKIDCIADYLLLNFVLSRAILRYKTPLWERNKILRAIRFTSLAEDEGKKYIPLPQEWEKYVKEE